MLLSSLTLAGCSAAPAESPRLSLQKGECQGEPISRAQIKTYIRELLEKSGQPNVSASLIEALEAELGQALEPEPGCAPQVRVVDGAPEDETQCSAYDPTREAEGGVLSILIDWAAKMAQNPERLFPAHDVAGEIRADNWAFLGINLHPRYPQFWLPSRPTNPSCIVPLTPSTSAPSEPERREAGDPPQIPELRPSACQARIAFSRFDAASSLVSLSVQDDFRLLVGERCYWMRPHSRDNPAWNLELPRPVLQSLGMAVLRYLKENCSPELAEPSDAG